MLVFTIVWDTPGKEKVAKWSSAPASILEGFNEIYAVYGPKKPYKTREKRQSCQIDPCLPPYCTPLYREAGVAMPLSHCASCGIADYRCYTPTSFHVKIAYGRPKTDLTSGVSQRKLASGAYRAIGGVTRNSLANHAIVGHSAILFLVGISAPKNI